MQRIYTQSHRSKEETDKQRPEIERKGQTLQFDVSTTVMYNQNTKTRKFEVYTEVYLKICEFYKHINTLQTGNVCL